MRLYVVGPMTGKPYYNWEAFRDAQKVWSWKGHEVNTPFDATNIIWNAHFGRDFNPYVDKCDYGHPLMLAHWLEDTRILLWADAIILLRGWESSRGSRVEVQTALLMGKRIFSAERHEELHLKVEVSFREG